MSHPSTLLFILSLSKLFKMRNKWSAFVWSKTSKQETWGFSGPFTLLSSLQVKHLVKSFWSCHWAEMLPLWICTMLLKCGLMGGGWLSSVKDDGCSALPKYQNQKIKITATEPLASCWPWFQRLFEKSFIFPSCPISSLLLILEISLRLLWKSLLNKRQNNLDKRQLLT